MSLHKTDTTCTTGVPPNSIRQLKNIIPHSHQLRLLHSRHPKLAQLLQLSLVPSPQFSTSPLPVYQQHTHSLVRLSPRHRGAPDPAHRRDAVLRRLGLRHAPVAPPERGPIGLHRPLHRGVEHLSRQLRGVEDANELSCVHGAEEEAKRLTGTFRFMSRLISVISRTSERRKCRREG